jgi:hypothetical protein
VGGYCISYEREEISSDRSQATEKTRPLSMLLMKALLVLGLHRLQVPINSKRSLVTRVALGGQKQQSLWVASPS